MRAAEDWAGLTLGREVTLVLGWHQGRRLAAGRLSLGDKMDRPLRDRAEASLAEIGSRKVREYEPSAFLEDEEVFLLTIDMLPRRSAHLASDRRHAVI